MTDISLDLIWKEPITPRSGNKKLTYGFVTEAISDNDLDAAIEALKCSIMIHHCNDFPQQHFEIKKDVLTRLKPLINLKPPLIGADPSIVDSYELFRTYYEIVKKLYTVESRQYCVRSHKTVPFHFKLSYVSGYNRWRKSIQYFTLFITLVSNIFKMALAKLGGRASFIGTVLQGFAHLCFALYFIFLTNDDKALALPKVFGFIVSVMTAIWIAEAGNGFL